MSAATTMALSLNYVADLEDEVALEGLDGITVEGKESSWIFNFIFLSWYYTVSIIINPLYLLFFLSNFTVSVGR